jgi:DNA polymerase I-like protein with 3'-5' exonuclease and polymerase domains
VFQGRAADGIKRAGWYIAQECYTGYSKYWTREEHGAQRSPLFGSFIVLMLHDELILEVPEARAHEAVNRQSEVMILGMREVVPDVKVGTEFAVARRWYKKAAAVYGTDGRIRPWEPKAK